MPKVHNLHHGTAPADAIYVGRGSPWGNPYVVGVHAPRGKCIDLFVENILPTLDVSELKGKDLVCYCKPKACHADHILAKANPPEVDDFYL